MMCLEMLGRLESTLQTGIEGFEPQTPSAISPSSSEPAGAGPQECQLPSQNSMPQMKFPRGLPVPVLLWSAPRRQLDKKWLKAGNSMFL